MNNIQNAWILVMLVTITALFPPVSAEPQTIKIGDIASSTSDLLALQAISSLAITDINQYMAQNGHPYRFEAVIRDASGSANIHLDILRSLKDAGVNLVIGGRWSSHVQGSISYIDENKMLLVSPTSTLPTLAIPGDNFFRTCTQDLKQGPILAKMLWSYGVKAIVVIQREDAIADGEYFFLKQEFEKMGGAILNRIRYPVEATEWTGYLESAEGTLSSAKATYGIDSLAVLLISYEESVNLVSRASNYPTIYSVTWFGDGGTGHLQKLINEAPTQSSKLHVYSLSEPTMESEIYSSVNDRFYAMTYQPLGHYGSCAYDAYWLCAHSIIKAGSAEAMNVKAALPSVAANYFGASGWCKLDDKGDRFSQDYDISGYGKVGASFKNVRYGHYSEFRDQILWYTQAKTSSNLSGKISPVIVYKGSNITVTGTLNPNLSSVTIKLYYLKPGGSMLIREAITNVYGTYVDSYSPSELGQWAVQTAWEGDSNYFGSESYLQTFNVKHGGPIIFDKAIVSDDRCDVNTIQTVSFHASWSDDKSNVVNGLINIGETGAKTNSTGWATFNYTLDEVGMLSGFQVSEVSCDGISTFKSDAPDVSITWDKVILNLNGSEPSLRTMIPLVSQRVDVGSETIEWTGLYRYDMDPFRGAIRLNDTLGKSKAGAYWYAVTGIDDPKHELSAYESNAAKVIYDRVKIVERGASANSVTVNQPLTVWCKAVYEYDGEAFNGEKGVLEINGEPLTWSSANKRWEKEYTVKEPKTVTFQVSGISDNRYGLKTFSDSSGQLVVEWKQAGIPGYPLGSMILGLIFTSIIYLIKRKHELSLIH